MAGPEKRYKTFTVAEKRGTDRPGGQIQQFIEGNKLSTSPER